MARCTILYRRVGNRLYGCGYCHVWGLLLLGGVIGVQFKLEFFLSCSRADSQGLII